MLDLYFWVWLCHLSAVVPNPEEEESLNIFSCLYFIIILKRVVEARHCRNRVCEWSCVNSDCFWGNSKRTGLSSLSTKLFLDCSLVSLPSVLNRSGFPADYLSAQTTSWPRVVLVIVQPNSCEHAPTTVYSLIHVHFAHVTLLNPQRINHLMPQIKSVTSWDFGVPHFQTPLSQVHTANQTGNRALPCKVHSCNPNTWESWGLEDQVFKASVAEMMYSKLFWTTQDLVFQKKSKLKIKMLWGQAWSPAPNKPSKVR